MHFCAINKKEKMSLGWEVLLFKSYLNKTFASASDLSNTALTFSREFI